MTRSEPIRAVVDTNLLVSALILTRGTPHTLLLAWYRGAFQLLVSPRVEAEYARVLPRPKFQRVYGVTRADIESFLTLVAERAVVVTPLSPLPLDVRDPHDVMILAAALGGAADYLVTGDDDLLVLAGDPRLGALQIVTARAFLDILQNAE
ncbi:MAG TPA: putative toxin-antitoxin system toxin component, PIN family [Thermomicrobiales bacterium]|nr:putative toxin-antitoxin system toxin component, PIN family [Thermomicrobiales bacterium]